MKHERRPLPLLKSIKHRSEYPIELHRLVLCLKNSNFIIFIYIKLSIIIYGYKTLPFVIAISIFLSIEVVVDVATVVDMSEVAKIVLQMSLLLRFGATSPSAAADSSNDRELDELSEE
jgi:hypothetical protein